MTAAESSPPAHPTRSGWKKLRFCALYLLFLLVIAETGARLYWRFTQWVSPFHPSELIYQRFYPELRPLMEAPPPTSNPRSFELLLLGGSVLDDGWGDIGQRLEQVLDDMGRPGSRVYNLASPAHTSRDSLLKYQRLDKRFDLVLVYHGINEVRMNNCPPEMFRQDYSHTAWYSMVNALEPGQADWVLLPFTMRYIWINALDRAGAYASWGLPKKEWFHYGAQVLSEKAFESNISGIVQLAQARGEPVLLATFAYRVPEEIPTHYDPKQMPGYAKADFKGACPIELWGDLENVTAGIDRHNDVTRRLAGQHPHVTLVDVAAAMSHDFDSFADICHLTRAGCEQFVAHVWPSIKDQATRRE